MIWVLVERNETHPPKWMGRLQEANARFAVTIGKRAESVHPRIREWMNANSWIVNEAVLLFFLAMAFF